MSLAGLALQYAEKAASFGAPLADGGPSDDVLPLPAATLAPGEYFLIGLGTKGVGSGAALPTPDATGTINLGANSGKVAITSSTTPLDCGSAAARCPQTDIVDMVGYGASSDYEGSGPVATLSKTTAALRSGDGCIDTRDNASDFSVGTPAPRNSATALFVCGSTPSDAGAGAIDGGGNSADAGGGMDGSVVMGEDSGAMLGDSGGTFEDSGATSADSSAPGGGGEPVSDDSGAPAAGDGGPVTGSGGSSGCSCSTFGARGHADWMEALGAALSLTTTARRRRRRS